MGDKITEVAFDRVMEEFINSSILYVLISQSVFVDSSKDMLTTASNMHMLINRSVNTPHLATEELHASYIHGSSKYEKEIIGFENEESHEEGGEGQSQGGVETSLSGPSLDTMSEDEKQRLAASSGLSSTAIDRIGETVMGSKNTTTVIDWAIFKAPEFLGFLSQGVKVIIHFLPDSEGKDDDDDDDDSDDDEEEDDDVEENIYHRHERFRRRHRRNASSMYAEKKKLEVERRDKARLEERTRRVTRVMFLTDNKTTLKLMRLVGEELVEGLSFLLFLRLLFFPLLSN